jgi:hypothetical protein
MSTKISEATVVTDLAPTDLFALAKDTGVGPTGFSSRHVAMATLLGEIGPNIDLSENESFLSETTINNIRNEVYADITTSDVTEGTNLYFSQARIRTQVEEELDTTYTLALEDADHKWKTLENASAITLTVPPQTSVAWPAGTYIEIMQGSSGQIAFAEGAGVTILANENLTRYTNGIYAVAALKRLAEDVWVVFGNLEPA